MAHAPGSKTRKSVAKRFKVTGSGKVKRHKQGRRHLMASKNSKRRRHLRSSTLVDAVDLHRIKESLPSA